MKGILFTIVSFFFILLLSLSYFSKKGVNNTRTRMYRYLLIVEMLLLIFELISTIWIIYGPYSKIAFIIHRLHWYTGILWFSLLYYYSIVFLKDVKDEKIISLIKSSTKSITIFIILLIGNIVFFFIPFSPLQANDNFSYLPGPASYYVYGFSAMCVYFTVIYLIRNRKTTKRLFKITILSSL